MHKTCCFLSIALTASAVQAQSPWIPECGELVVTPGFTFSTFDSFWMGSELVDNPPNGKSLDQYTGYALMEYGFLPNFAADVTLGYTATDTDAFGGDSTDGLADTYLGLRWRAIDENAAAAAWMPTVTLRVGGIIAGDYDANTPFAPGDGVNAFESQLLLGKAIGDSGFGLFGEVGYRVRGDPAPDDFLGLAGIYQQIGPVTLSVAYRHVQGLDGLDIGGPGFDPAAGEDSGFPALKEINQLVEGSVAFTDRGGRTYAFTVAGSVDGRNTGDKLIFGFTLSWPFGPFEVR